MKSLVVLFALASVGYGSLIPIAQPPHSPAVVLDARGRPLDTAEVINARALHLQAKALEGHHGHGAPVAVVAPVAHSIAVAPAVIAAPAAVSHQSRVDVISGHGIAAPLLTHGALGYAGHGHYLRKRSLGHYAYAAPIVKVAVAPAAVSHQSRVDIHSSPAIVSHAVVAPYVHTAVVPIAHHAALAHINHAAVAPIVHAAPLVHAW